MPPNNAVGLHRRRAVAAARQSSPNIGARARGGDGVDGAGEARGTRGGRGSYNAWLHRPVRHADLVSAITYLWGFRVDGWVLRLRDHSELSSVQDCRAEKLKYVRAAKTTKPGPSSGLRPEG